MPQYSFLIATPSTPFRRKLTAFYHSRIAEYFYATPVLYSGLTTRQEPLPPLFRRRNRRAHTATVQSPTTHALPVDDTLQPASVPFAHTPFAAPIRNSNPIISSGFATPHQPQLPASPPGWESTQSRSMTTSSYELVTSPIPFDKASMLFTNTRIAASPPYPPAASPQAVPFSNA